MWLALSVIVALEIMISIDLIRFVSVISIRNII